MKHEVLFLLGGVQHRLFGKVELKSERIPVLDDAVHVRVERIDGRMSAVVRWSSHVLLLRS